VRTDSLKFLQELVEAPSPSGYENPIAQLYQTYVSQFTRHISADVSGNVIAVINPEAKMKIMLAGHMDEIGFIIHSCPPMVLKNRRPLSSMIFSTKRN
jgi:putative aminopeptidase FrvX